MEDNREYYKTEDGRSTMDIIVDKLGIEGAIAFCEGNVIKYNQRKGKKTTDPTEDEAKAYWYKCKALELRLLLGEKSGMYDPPKPKQELGGNFNRKEFGDGNGY